MLSNVPDFEKYRREKQVQADNDLTVLLQEYKEWLKLNTNLREKVRAKHLFAEQAGRKMEELEEQPWRQYFEDWFAFDYVTIIGSRLFDMFIKERAPSMPPSQVQLGGLVLTAALEPFDVLEKEEQSLLVTPLWRREEKRLTPLFQDEIPDNLTPTVLTRSIHCGLENRIFSPVIPLLLPSDNHILEEWKALFEEKEEENQRLRFMKENGAGWLAFAKAGT